MKDSCNEKLLAEAGCGYTVSGDKAVIDIADTMAALPVLEKIKDSISGFEVIQGTLDDVFLNVTGGVV